MALSQTPKKAAHKLSFVDNISSSCCVLCIHSTHTHTHSQTLAKQKLSNKIYRLEEEPKCVSSHHTTKLYIYYTLLFLIRLLHRVDNFHLSSLPKCERNEMKNEKSAKTKTATNV